MKLININFYVQSLCDGIGKSVKVARSPQNKKKNRFANISACKYLPVVTSCKHLFVNR